MSWKIRSQFGAKWHRKLGMSEKEMERLLAKMSKMRAERSDRDSGAKHAMAVTKNHFHLNESIYSFG